MPNILLDDLLFADPSISNPTDGGGIADGGTGAKLGTTAVGVAAIFALTATTISLMSIWEHLKNYRKPMLQRSVIRILWMVPIYALTTLISLLSLDTAFYLDTLRDLYEAFVIYCFFTLLLQRLGGERALLIELHARPPTQTFFPHTLVASNINLGDPYVFLFVKRGILQYVLVKPLLALTTMALKWSGHYQDGYISLHSGYFWVTLIYNFSVCLALWCLVVFFYATKEDLWDFRPLPKFLSVKAVIFFSFWQSCLISLLVAVGLIRETDHYTADNLAVAIQDFLICIEMVPAAFAHMYAFSYTDYLDPTKHSARLPLNYAVHDSFGIKDVVLDILDTLRGSRFNYRSFEPSEGIPQHAASRKSRIMAGLRYSSSGAAKYWVKGMRKTGYYSGPVVGTSRDEVERLLDDDIREEEDNVLYFDDIDENDEIEALYENSREMIYGDYNYPVVDFKDPIPPTSFDRIRGYGAVSTKQKANGSWIFGKSRKNKDKERKTFGRFWDEDPEENGEGPSMAEASGATTPTTKYKQVRDGCVDLVVDEGRGKLRINYSHDPQPQKGKSKPKPKILKKAPSSTPPLPRPNEHTSIIEEDAPEDPRREEYSHGTDPWRQIDGQGSVKSLLHGISFFNRPVEVDEDDVDGGVWKK